MNNNPYSPLPFPKPNSGLDTGFQASGPWGSIPSIYDASWQTRENLKSADGVPLAALFQLQAGIRPGNNAYISIPEIKRYNDPKLNIYCVPEICTVNENNENKCDCLCHDVTLKYGLIKKKCNCQCPKKYISIT